MKYIFYSTSFLKYNLKAAISSVCWPTDDIIILDYTYMYK